MLRKKAVLPILVPLVLATAVGIAAPGASAAAPDSTPPTLKTPHVASFVVGQSIPVGAPPDCYHATPGDGQLWIGVAERFAWSGADDSGPVTYSLTQDTGYAGTEDVFTDSRQTSYAAWGTNSGQDCGGGNHSVYQWDLTATDASGNSVTNTIAGGQITLSQDSNLVSERAYAPPATTTYAGSWGTSTCLCWSNRDAHKTTKRGASASVTVRVPAGKRASHIGLVMATGPDRGKFSVFVDGVRRGTVDTYARRPVNRVVVWETAVGEGTRTVKIVNQATAGRPRIDLDAVLTN